MNHQTFAAKNRRLIIILIGLVFLGNFPACATDQKKSKTYYPGDTQTVGIINPDGGKSVLMVPDDISDFLAGCSWQQIEGLNFYQFASWKDTASFLSAVNERQEHVIRELAANVQELTRRVGILERTRAPVRTQPVDSRIEALEQKVKEMSDGGNL